eukprot:TRINITY_DN221_c0_g1_i6.p1 TRINITY_DN221_c0_g1~~TRINITY_DN221_c0_g1_i6.p1  ORF type:complete len:309 (-),score=103.08 TRINITY_DN221_c0_g1_i6:85-1011(-)
MSSVSLKLLLLVATLSFVACSEEPINLFSRAPVCREGAFDELYKTSEEAVEMLQNCYDLSKSVDNAQQRAQCLKSCKRFMWSYHFPQCENDVLLRPCAENCDQFYADCQIDQPKASILGLCAEKGEQCEQGPDAHPRKARTLLPVTPNILRFGFNAPANATIFCPNYKPSDCMPAVNYQRFWCFNYALGIGVRCQESTWDNLLDLCVITNQYDPGCTTKSCVNNFRAKLPSFPPICQKVSNPPGDSEKWILCGQFQSNDPTNRVVALSNVLGGSMSFGPEGTGPFCKKLYNVWSKYGPISNDDLAFSL